MDEAKAGGFVVLWRALRNNKLWLSGSDAVRIVAITLLLYARWEDGEWTVSDRTYSLKKGERYWTLPELALACGKNMTEKRVRTALRTLEAWHFLVNKRAGRGRIISIENWGKYQVLDEETGRKRAASGQDGGRKKAVSGQDEGSPIYTNHITIEPQNQGTIHTSTGAPALQEVEEEVKKRHYTFEASAFYRYYEERRWCDRGGAPLRDWKKLLALWERNEQADRRRKKLGKKVYTMEDYARAMKGGDDNGWL